MCKTTRHPSSPVRACLSDCRNSACLYFELTMTKTQAHIGNREYRSTKDRFYFRLTDPIVLHLSSRTYSRLRGEKRHQRL